MPYGVAVSWNIHCASRRSPHTGYDVLVCQEGVPSDEPVWMRAVMVDANFAYPSDYNTTLGVLYFKDEDNNTLPTSVDTDLSPMLTPSLVNAKLTCPLHLLFAF